MSESNEIVRLPSPPSQSEQHKVNSIKGSSSNGPAKGETRMSSSQYVNVKPSAIAENGRLLVFAPPLMMGFRGCPLALSKGKINVKAKSSLRRNYAKRRAYAG